MTFLSKLYMITALTFLITRYVFKIRLEEDNVIFYKMLFVEVSIFLSLAAIILLMSAGIK